MKALLLMLLGVFTLGSVYGQSNLENLVQSANELPPQYKIYVFHDKPGYVAGETIWLSTYLVDASYHALNALSQTIYLELLSPDFQVVDSRILNSPLGVSWGDFKLPNDLPSGNYILRAYTNYMKNAGSEFFFHKEIPVASTEPGKVFATSPRTFDLRFFPEGGSFLIGVKNRIAFKATDENGRGTETSGLLLNSKGEVMDSINTIHDGMGEFTIVPAPGEKYSVKLNSGDQTYPLPDVQFSGYAMRITETSDAFEVFIYRNTSSEPGDLAIIAQSRNSVYFAAGGKITNSTKVKIPKEKLPTGITQITVFDEAGMPAVERLVFLNKPDGSSPVSISTDRETYGNRSKVQLNINMKDPSRDTVDALLSVSVYDRLSGDRQLSFRDYLYLNSDLRGHISDPGFYFSEDPNAAAYADLLMLTHGWRRLDWAPSEAPNTAYNHEKGVPIRGVISRELTKKSVGEAKVNILDVSSGGISIVQADEQGNFFSDELVFYDSADINIQTSNRKGNKSQFAINLTPFQSPSTDFAGTTLYQFPGQDRVSQAKEEQAITAGYFDPEEILLLEEVSVRATRIKNEVRTLFGTPDRTISTEDFPTAGATNILDLLRGRFAGVQVSGNPLDPVISIRGGGEPLFLLDGIQVPKSALLSVPPATIETIDLMKGNEAAIFGSNGANGVLAFYTRQGYQDYQGPPVGMNTIKVRGYSSAKEFYSPDYGITSDRHNLPDQRSTLYWNPLVKPDAMGNISLEFYTGDLNADYEVRVEGITINGIPASGESTFTTRQNADSIGGK